MLRLMLIKQMLIGLAVISTPFMMASCNDDGGSNDPSVEKGTVDAQASGSANVDLSGGNATFQDSTGTSQFFNGQQFASTQVTWSGNGGNTMSFNLTKLKSSSIGTGKFEILDLSSLADPDLNRFIGNVSATIDSVEYSGESGAIKVTTKNSSNVIGKFQDLKLESFVGSDSVTLNGAFHATK